MLVWITAHFTQIVQSVAVITLYCEDLLYGIFISYRYVYEENVSTIIKFGNCLKNYRSRKLIPVLRKDLQFIGGKRKEENCKKMDGTQKLLKGKIYIRIIVHLN